MVTTTTTGGQRVAICTCTQTGRHLATFTCRPGSSLYTLTTEPPQVAAFGQHPLARVASCRTRLSFGTTALVTPPCHAFMACTPTSLFLVFPDLCLPSHPRLPHPCNEGRQRAAPHSSSFPPTTAPLQTLCFNVWGPARVSGQGHERYFLLVVDDYTRYNTVFPLRSKEVVSSPTSCIVGRASFTLTASPQKNGVAERRIGLVIDVARTSMIHAVAPHFLWPFAVRYAAHQLNLWPRVSLPETSPALRWTGKVGDASVFRVWGSRAFVCDTFADKLSSRAIPYVFLGFPPDAPGWKSYHPTSRRVLPSQDIKFDESVPFYLLFPYRTAPLPLRRSSLLQGPAPSGVSQVNPLPLDELVEVTVDSGAAARGAVSGGAEPAGAEPGGAERASVEPGGAKPECAELGGADTEGAELGGAESEGADSGGAEPRGTGSAGGPAGASPQQSHRREPLSPRQLREWFAHCTRLRSGAAGAGGPAARGTRAGGAGATSPGGAGVTARAGGTGGAGAAGPGGARTRGTGAAGAGGVGGAGAGDPGAGGTGGGGAGSGGTGAGGASAGGARAGGAGAGDPGAGGAGAGGDGAGSTTARDPGAGGTGSGDPVAGGAGAGNAGARGARAGGTRARGTGAGGAGAGGAGAGGAGAGGNGAGAARARDPGAGGAGAGGAGAGGTGAGGTVQRRPFFVPPPPSSLPPPGSVIRQVFSLPSSTGLTPRLLCPPHHQSQPQLQQDSPLPAPSPYAEQTDSLTERCEPKSLPASHVRAVCTGPRVPRPRPPPVPGTHIIALRPSSVPLRVPLSSPSASSLLDIPDPESDLARAISSTVPRLLSTVVTDSSYESAAASALVAELVDFAAARRLDYAASLVAESESDYPPSVGGECALGTDVLEDRQEDFECLEVAVPHLVAMLLAPEGDPDAPDIPTPRSYAEAIMGPYSSQWQTAMNAKMASWKSTGTYVDALTPSGANIVDGMWILRVKRPPGSLLVFKARYVARGFS
ncbi:unnamed protein product [Closterium sp. NIES-54]